jgi:hypothetical protein
MTTRVDLPADDAERELVDELAVGALATLAPAELAIYADTSTEFYQDPDRVLGGSRRDEAVGFGLDLALMTPFVIAVASSVVHLLGSIIGEAVKDEGVPAAHTLLRRLLRRPSTPADPTAAEPLALSAAQARQVRDVALARAQALGVPDAQAQLLADAITGGLVVA